MDKRDKQILINSRNGFYSFCRKINEFNCDHEKLVEYINKVTSLYVRDEKGVYYLRYIDYLKNKIVKRTITPSEGAYILINSVDPDYEIYQIYENYSNIYDIKDECMKKFHFFDMKFLDLEKLYIKLNNLEDEYSFTKRKELK